MTQFCSQPNQRYIYNIIYSKLLLLATLCACHITRHCSLKSIPSISCASLRRAQTNMASNSNNVISSIEPMSSLFKTLDPFLFCAYHTDNYPAGDSQMRAPRRGNGADFDPNAPYRMYHGDRIPGFPQVSSVSLCLTFSLCVCASLPVHCPVDTAPSLSASILTEASRL